MPLNRRQERFAQLLAAGTLQIDAYAQAGYQRQTSSAARLAATPEIKARVAELLAAGASEAVEALTAKQQFIKLGWKKLAEGLKSLSLESAHEISALADKILAAEKDQRVVDGGVSDRSESIQDVTSRTESDDLADEIAAELAAKNKARSEGMVARDTGEVEAQTRH